MCHHLQFSLPKGLRFIRPDIPSLRYFIFLKIPSAPSSHHLLDSSQESSIWVLSVIYITTIRIKQLTSIFEAIRVHQPEITACGGSSYILDIVPMKAGGVPSRAQPPHSKETEDWGSGDGLGWEGDFGMWHFLIVNPKAYSL